MQNKNHDFLLCPDPKSARYPILKFIVRGKVESMAEKLRSWGMCLFQSRVKQEKTCLVQNLSKTVTFMPLNKELKNNNIKPFPVDGTRAFSN